MPLAMIEAGGRARVAAIHGSDTIKKHLGSLGFVPGAILTVVQVVSGSMIVGIHDSRIAVNDDLVRRIAVEPV